MKVIIYLHKFEVPMMDYLILDKALSSLKFRYNELSDKGISGKEIDELIYLEHCKFVLAQKMNELKFHLN